MDKRCEGETPGWPAGSSDGARWRARGRAAVAAAALILVLSACDRVKESVLLDPFTTDGPFRTVAADDPRLPETLPRLRMELPTLTSIAARAVTRLDPEAGVYERRRIWRTEDPTRRAASIVFRQRLDGAALAVPADMRESLALWPDLALRKASFRKLYRTQSALGTVLWRRFVSGGRICVLFRQDAAGTAATVPRLVAGYYCAAAGEGLSPGQAESVVQAVRVSTPPR